MRPIDADALQERLKKKKPDPAVPRYVEGFNDALLRFKSMVHSAPTVEPERKKGKWIEIKNSKGAVIALRCDQCLLSPKNGVRSDFCPNCGSDNRGKKE